MRPITVSINVSIRQDGFSGNTITLAEQFELPPTDFEGFASIMKCFHELAEEIKKQSGVKTK